MNSLVPLFILIPLGTAFLIAIFGRLIKNFCKVILPATLLYLLALTVYLIFDAPETLVYNVGGFALVNGIPVSIYLVVDGLTKILLLIIFLIGFLAVFYSVTYSAQYTAERKYYILFSLMIAGMSGMVISGDIFNMYVFLEISAISSYALVAFGIEKQQLEASFKYQVLGGIASLMILMSIGFIYWFSGTLNLADISRQIVSGGVLIKFVSVLLICGFGLKAAVFPFHSWLPDAHSSAPSPISAMLSGVLIKAIGIYVILRLFFNMFPLSHDIAMTITILGTISMIIGGILAYGQWDIKRMLAYSSISQIGCVVLGIGVGMLVLVDGGSKSIAALAIAGGLFHLLNHAVFKGLLFLSAGAVEYRTHTRDMRKMGGLSELMPVTSSSSLIASLAISGIPPFNGFFSKLMIIVALVKARYYFLAFCAVAVTIITIAYFLKLQKYTFFNRNKSFWQKKGIKEVPFTMAFSLIILSVLCLGLSLLVIPELRETVLNPAVNVLMKTVSYSENILR